MSSTNQHFTIAIVGRPNVGKSTLFNRLIGTRKAVVSSIRGTTRDRVYGETVWRGVPVALIDTGGFEFAKVEGLPAAVQRHLRRAVDEADGIVLVCDAQEGLVPADAMIIDVLRNTGKPIVLAANKMDHRLMVPPEFFSLGIEPIYPISALHGRGTGELLDHLVKTPISSFASLGASRGIDGLSTAAIAIIGRQNVGKSSLFNALLREERAIVSEVPGTTRDTVDTLLRLNDQSVLIIDTAGLRHRRKVKSPIDLFSMSRTIDAIVRCDVVLVVLDATMGVTSDDRRIVGHVLEVGRGLVLLVNKWDLVKGTSEPRLTEIIHRALPSAAFAPVLAVSAKTGFQVARSLSTALDVGRAMRREVPAHECLAIVRRIWDSHLTPRLRGRPIQLREARWLPGRPVHLELAVSPFGQLPRPFHQYLLKRLYVHPTWKGVPIRVITRKVAPR